MTTKDFIEKIPKEFKEKYDISNIRYVNSKEKIEIICSKHGKFYKRYDQILKGQGCPKCSFENLGKKQTLTSEEFINKMKNKGYDKYDFSKVEYINAHTKVCIICKKHGKFYATPANLLQGYGCPECGKERVRELRLSNTEEFIKKAQEIHKNEKGSTKYDYSKVEYIDAKTNVCIICSKHGEFWQTPASHLRGRGCPKCGNLSATEQNRLPINVFYDRVNKLYNGKYSYNNLIYQKLTDIIEIICPIHGTFYKSIHNHLNGVGCPKCKESHIEKEVRINLENKQIEYEYQKKFDWLKNMSIDFYLKDYNIAIECQGIQHFNPSGKIFTNETVNKTIKRDEIKRKLCEENGIKLLYYSNLNIDYPYQVYTDINELLKEILNSKN